MSDKVSKIEDKCFCRENIYGSDKENFYAACFDEAKYIYQGKTYCILHYPFEGKSIEFQLSLQQKLSNGDFNFCGVWFPNSENFVKFEFNSKADFSYSYFSKEVNFSFAIFKNSSSFRDAEFNGVNFKSATFEKDVDFSGITIKSNASFQQTIFLGKADFKHCNFLWTSSFLNATFSDANFESATFLNRTVFSSAKFNLNSTFLLANFKKAEFNYCEFHKEVNFGGAVFEGQALFTDAVFYENVNFQNAKFRGYSSFSRIHKLAPIPHSETKLMIPIVKIDFSYAEFDEITFDFAKLQNIFFFRTKFNEEASFWVTTFTKFADFRGSVFNSKANFTRIILENGADVRFREATFKDYLIFDNSHDSLAYDFSKASLNLRDAKMEKPENCRFHSISLHPNWFINTDTRKFEFSNIDWINVDGNQGNVKKELECFQEEYVNSNSYRLLTVTCRQLAHNAEENNRYEEASSFRRMALETERLERKEKRKIWLTDFGNIFRKEIKPSNLFAYSGTAIKNFWSLIKTFPSDVLHFLYRVFSGYGERWFRAFCWLMIIWLFWAFLYATPICDFIEKEKYSCSYWIAYSLNVITLQRPEPKPANIFTMIVLGLEVLLAPLQTALLILAVRRKFMR